MELDSVSKVLNAFYRLVGTESDDQDLVIHGEAADEVAYTYLTRGCRASQRYMLSVGYSGWRKRSSAITWSGTDAANGGRYTDLPTDFLRAWGTGKRTSCLREADGDQWGSEIPPEDDWREGDYYYFRGLEELWLARTARPPSTVYLEYHHVHDPWDGSLSAIDFPMDARGLIPAMSAEEAMADNWLPGGPEMEGKIVRAVNKAQEEVRRIVRPSKTPRTFKKPMRYGNRW